MRDHTVVQKGRVNKMIIELEKEPRRLRLHSPTTELKISPIELPLILTSKTSDDNNNLWEIKYQKLS